MVHVKRVLGRSFISTVLLLSTGRANGQRVSRNSEKHQLWPWSSESQCERTWLTLGWQQGKENKCTLPKSSAEASRDPSCDLHTALMSVPSAPSGQIPDKAEKNSSKFPSQKCLKWGCTRRNCKIRCHENTATFYPHTKSVKAERAGGSGPLHVTHRVHVGHMFAAGSLPWNSHAMLTVDFGFCSRSSRLKLRELKAELQHTEEDFIVAWVGDEVTAVFGPVHMCDEAGVALRKQTLCCINSTKKPPFIRFLSHSH